jgi:predicted kinase
MANPNSRSTLLDYCLRKLGAPVLEINVDADQLEDRIDEALQVYQEFHSDATIKTYLKHLVTSTDVTNKYIPI